MRGVIAVLVVLATMAPSAAAIPDYDVVQGFGAGRFSTYCDQPENETTQIVHVDVFLDVTRNTVLVHVASAAMAQNEQGGPSCVGSHNPSSHAGLPSDTIAETTASCERAEGDWVQCETTRFGQNWTAITVQPDGSFVYEYLQGVNARVTGTLTLLG